MTWQQDAACRDADPELFFPPTDDDTSLTVARHKMAVAPMCGRCPVATDCLRWALDSGQDHGLWAATTPTDRRAIRRAHLAGVPTSSRTTSRCARRALCCSRCRRSTGSSARAASSGRPREGRRRLAPPTLVARLRDRFLEQRAAEAHRHLEDDLRMLWREACTGVGLCHYVHVAAGTTIRTPRFGGLRQGDGLAFSTELLPGQEPEDLRGQATRLAHTLGAHGLRVEPLAGRWVRIVLLQSDPLTGCVPLPELPLAHGAGRLVLGRGEDGTAITHRLTGPAHLAIQGRTPRASRC